MTTVSTEPRSQFRAWLGVAAITASLFVFVTTELMPIGLLTPVSAGLSVSVGLAGMMVTLYGISAGVGVPFLVAWSRKVNRRALLATLLAIMAVGNLLTAVSPNFPIVLAARLVTGFAHGVFWAIGVAMAMRLVPDKKASKAAAVVLSGMSIATVVGMPLGTFIESLTDWRTTFLIWSGLSLAVLLAVVLTLPSLPSQSAIPVREVFALPIRNGRMRVVLTTVVLYVLGHFGAYTFIRPFMEQRAGASAAWVTGLLIVFGVGGAVGNFVAGHTVNRNMRATFVVACTGLVASLLLLLVLGGSPVGLVVAVVVWGVSFGAANLCQVNMMLAAAPDTFEAAMSLNTMGYNISIALGALLGGLFAGGFGPTGAVWFGVALTVTALLTAIGSHRDAAQAGKGHT
ncbi:MFS transporter [Amycolatopsis regifaucium]|uniref:MFS transporter n=2 Tax=Amycolatopsis regifaucium TaxID=546365 RepID=A0ABX3DQN9_9PSEU|nr:MFS transporter [Amycolatopsis regifaucium]OKA06167.1 MFS transporter [Amycolatopsis regifaucium]SFG70809.1 Predicted arabinose efflux permease, MFS family [Amycolatopsis regifaucium]